MNQPSILGIILGGDNSALDDLHPAWAPVREAAHPWCAGAEKRFPLHCPSKHSADGMTPSLVLVDSCAINIWFCFRSCHTVTQLTRLPLLGFCLLMASDSAWSSPGWDSPFFLVFGDIYLNETWGLALCGSLCTSLWTGSIHQAIMGHLYEGGESHLEQLHEQTSQKN